MTRKILVCEGDCNPAGLVARHDAESMFQMAATHGRKLVHTPHIRDGRTWKHAVYRCEQCGTKRVFGRDDA